MSAAVTVDDSFNAFSHGVCNTGLTTSGAIDDSVSISESSDYCESGSASPLPSQVVMVFSFAVTGCHGFLLCRHRLSWFSHQCLYYTDSSRVITVKPLLLSFFVFVSHVFSSSWS